MATVVCECGIAYHTAPENLNKNHCVQCRCGRQVPLILPQQAAAGQPPISSVVPPAAASATGRRRRVQAGLLVFYGLFTLWLPYAWQLSAGATLALLGWWALENRPRLAGFASLLAAGVTALTLLLLVLLVLATTQPADAPGLTPPAWLLRLDAAMLALRDALGNTPLLTLAGLGPLLLALYVLARLRPEWAVFSRYDRMKGTVERVAAVLVFLGSFTFFAPTFAEPLLEHAWRHQYRLAWRTEQDQNRRRLLATELQRQVAQATTPAPQPVRIPYPLRPSLTRALVGYWSPPAGPADAPPHAAASEPVRQQAHADADVVLASMGHYEASAEASVATEAEAAADAQWAAARTAHRADWPRHRRPAVAALAAEARRAEQQANNTVEFVSKLIGETLGFAVDQLPLPVLKSFVGGYLKELVNYGASRLLDQESIRDFVVRLFDFDQSLSPALGKGLLSRLRGFWQRQRTPLFCNNDKCHRPVSADAERGDICPHCKNPMFEAASSTSRVAVAPAEPDELPAKPSPPEKTPAEPAKTVQYTCLVCGQDVPYACLGCICPKCGARWNKQKHSSADEEPLGWPWLPSEPK